MVGQLKQFNTNNEDIPGEYKVYRKDKSDGYGGILLAISGLVLCDISKNYQCRDNFSLSYDCFDNY